jgi:cobyrinic acid a,c-diamide synthase
MKPERFAHEIARKARIHWQWMGLMEAASRASIKAAAKTRRDLVARRISLKKFHQIRAAQEAALDVRLTKLERELFKK